MFVNYTIILKVGVINYDNSHMSEGVRPKSSRLMNEVGGR